MSVDIGLPPGYYRNPLSGGIESLPWPKKLEDLPYSLGFQLIEWAESNLIHHQTGEPWRYSLLQKRFLVLWYAVDENGRFLYRSGVMRMAKGSGKDPMLATMALMECLGPVLFHHFDAITGRPVGAPHRMSLVLLASNSERQSQELLFVANGMVSGDLKAQTGYEAGKLGSSTPSGSRIKLLTSSVRTAEGDPASAVFLNESHHMTAASGGRGVAEVARRNVAKFPGGQARLLEGTNAHEPGGLSVAEDSYHSWQTQVAGKTLKKDILYCSVEADPKLSFTDLLEAESIIRQAYFYSPWIDKERILAEVDDMRTTPADAIRFFANGLAAAETAYIEPNNYDLGTISGEILQDGTEIAMFLDCSKNDDDTSLAVVRIEDGFPFLLENWSKPRGERGRSWQVPREEVDMVVRAALERYDVVWFGVDPSPATDDDGSAYWGSVIEGWVRDFGKEFPVNASSTSPIMWDMRQSTEGGKNRIRQFTEMAQRVRVAIDDDRTFTHDDNPVLAMHFKNARLAPNAFGRSISKENRDSPKKIDGAVAVIAALVGRNAYITSGKTKSRRSGVVWV